MRELYRWGADVFLLLTVNCRCNHSCKDKTSCKHLWLVTILQYHIY